MMGEPFLLLSNTVVQAVTSELRSSVSAHYDRGRHLFPTFQLLPLTLFPTFPCGLSSRYFSSINEDRTMRRYRILLLVLLLQLSLQAQNVATPTPVVESAVDPYRGAAVWQCADVAAGTYVLTMYDDDDQPISTAEVRKL